MSTSRFKNAFGEMKYYLKNDRFVLVLEKLSEMVEFESDPAVMNVRTIKKTQICCIFGSFVVI